MRLWVPGKFPSANKAFELARRAGALREGHRLRGLPGQPRDPFNEAARRVREHVRLFALSAGWGQIAEPEQSANVYIVRHPRWDDDAGAWAGKLAIDALYGHHGDHAARFIVRVLRAGDEHPEDCECPASGPGMFIHTWVT